MENQSRRQERPRLEGIHPGILQRARGTRGRLRVRSLREGLLRNTGGAIPLKRAASHAFEAIQNAREALKGYTDLIEIRDLAYDNERHFDLLVQDARNAVDFKIARESEEQADLSKEALVASHKLNRIAALFFPLTALTSVFGMNMNSGLESGGAPLFWVIFGLGTATGFVMKSWVVKPIPK